ncbi:MAG: inner membrane protein [Acidobacteria bacterium]|nr:MAG: inner membrane protein [Acidobacteriota bacterium]
MHQVSPVPLSVMIRNISRSIGLKLVLVSGLALLMSIPAFFVSDVVDERAKRASDVRGEISGRTGGQQTFLGPSLTIPFTFPLAPKEHSSGVYVVFPTKGDATVKIHTEERRRSLFKVPVYQADLKFDASFDLTNVPSALPSGAELDWSRAAIVVGASDVRGALVDGALMVDGKKMTFVPAGNVGEDNPRLPLAYFGVRATDWAKANATFDVTANLRFSGAQRIAFLAYGKSTHIAVDGDWPSPGFDGGFLPVKRAISPQGFSSEWSVPFIARGVPAEGTNTVVSGLDRTGMGISLIEVADPYQSVNRSVKYALLFVALLFLSYFVFEATSGKRVHPAQYILVGVAHLIFYLLLLSLAERFGFDCGFLVAAVATVLLLSANAKWIFASRTQGLRALFVFSLLYFFIYMLLRLEDNALLVGAVASFLAVTAVMYFTRNLDWYSAVIGSSKSTLSSESDS